MIEKFIEFFINRHLLTNMIFISVILGGLFTWQEINKEVITDINYTEYSVQLNKRLVEWLRLTDKLVDQSTLKTKPR